MTRDDHFFFALKHNIRSSAQSSPSTWGGGRGRRRRGVVRVALLMLLAEEPRNGYQLMQEIEERSGGRWRPSPGAVYPALSQLEDEGLIRSIERDGVKLLELTDTGRSHIDDRHEGHPPWEEPDDPEALDDLRSQVKQLHVAAVQVAQAGNEEQIADATRAVSEARRTMYRILAEDTDE
ncbi:MAG TPA: PadR family transcriptional regulator [Solirubrobacteraceae bacterium]|jgi:DNA-binding PadR family transcriptional regulator